MEKEKKSFAETATIPNSAEEIKIPVKFNKQIIKLSLEDAAVLCQKGMKFDLISEELARLKELAAAENLNISDFLSMLENKKRQTRREMLVEKCGGDDALADYILELEGVPTADRNTDFEEVKRYFPEIKSISDLPEAVKVAAELKGSGLLNELLRYRLKKQRSIEAVKSKQSDADFASIGSQREALSVDYDPAKLQFLKGLWNR